jgi:hypothetical protein
MISAQWFRTIVCDIAQTIDPFVSLWSGHYLPFRSSATIADIKENIVRKKPNRLKKYAWVMVSSSSAKNKLLQIQKIPDNARTLAILVVT